jgi:hypothetical protein
MSYLPNDLSLDTTLDNVRIQQNDAALDNAISGNLTQANLSSATQIPNSMLASPNVEEFITFSFGGGTGSTIPTASTSIPIAIIRIPGNATYTVLGATYAFVAPTGGGTTGSVSISAGTITGSVFAPVSTIGVSTLLPVVSSNQSAAADITLSTTSFTAPNVLALLSTVAGVTAAIRLTVTLRVTRSLQ